MEVGKKGRPLKASAGEARENNLSNKRLQQAKIGDDRAGCSFGCRIGGVLIAPAYSHGLWGQKRTVRAKGRVQPFTDTSNLMGEGIYGSLVS